MAPFWTLAPKAFGHRLVCERIDNPNRRSRRQKSQLLAESWIHYHVHLLALRWIAQTFQSIQAASNAPIISDTQFLPPAAQSPSSSAQSPPVCPPPRRTQSADQIALSNAPPPLHHPDARQKYSAPKDSPSAAKAPDSIPQASAPQRRQSKNPPALSSSDPPSSPREYSDRKS